MDLAAVSSKRGSMRWPAPLALVLLSPATTSCLLSKAVMTSQRTRSEVSLSRAVQVPADPSTLRLILHGDLRSTGPGVYVAEIAPWPPEASPDGVRRAYLDCTTLRFLGQRAPAESGHELAVKGQWPVVVADCGAQTPCEIDLVPGHTLTPLGWGLLPLAGLADVVTFPVQAVIYFRVK